MLKHRPKATVALEGASPVDWLNVMIIYEDRETFRVAERISDRLVVATEAGCCVRLTLRSFEVLSIRSIRELAAAEAREADLVLFSIYEHGDWPEGVTEWMALVSGEPRARRGGLAALLVKSEYLLPHCPVRRAALEEMAVNNGRDFFIAKDVWLGRPEHHPAYE